MIAAIRAITGRHTSDHVTGARAAGSGTGTHTSAQSADGNASGVFFRRPFRDGRAEAAGETRWRRKFRIVSNSGLYARLVCSFCGATATRSHEKTRSHEYSLHRERILTGVFPRKRVPIEKIRSEFFPIKNRFQENPFSWEQVLVIPMRTGSHRNELFMRTRYPVAMITYSHENTFL